ncbi:MAG: hypothetical protein ACK44W_10885, partial [Planctomycetota bacterium]
MIQSLLDGIYNLIHEGRYEAALQAAKRLSIERLKENRRAEAAMALAAAGHALCLLNSPSKARSFAQEAHDLAARAEDRRAAGYALAVGALARLRMGEYDAADTLIDRALEALQTHPD